MNTLGSYIPFEWKKNGPVTTPWFVHCRQIFQHKPIKLAMDRLVNTLRPKQNCHHFAGDIFNSIFLNENIWILLKISLKFVLDVWINNIPWLVQVIAWCWPGNKSLSEPNMVNLLMHTWHHHYWVNTLRPRQNGRHFPDDIFKWKFLNENVWISIKISLKFVPKGQINNIPSLV